MSKRFPLAFRTVSACDPLQHLLQMERLEQRHLLTALANPLSEFGELEIQPDTYDTSSILVRFQSGLDEAVRVTDGLQGAVVGRAPLELLPSLRRIHLSPGLDVGTALGHFKADPSVRYAEPDYRVYATSVPDDSRFNDLWNLHNIGQTGGVVDADIDAPGGWDITVGSGSTVVAVIDTGVNYHHIDLSANMWVNPGEIPGDNRDNDGNGFIDDVHGYDFANNDPDPTDDQGHGTHVAGTIGAVGNNGIGVAGINWNVQIMALKFLGADGSGTTSAAIEAINYAVANGAEISNNSWGGDPYSQALFDAIAAARDADHIFVTAAGNGDALGNGLDNDAEPFYPASYELDNIIAVAAVDDEDNLAAFSNYGATSVDLAAPGVNILSTTSNGGYGFNTGTSMASPHVAGVVALVRDLNELWMYDEVISQVLATVDPLPEIFGVTATGGRLNMAAALGNPEPPIPPGPAGELPILEDFTGAANFFQPRAGDWQVTDGTYHVTPVTDNSDLMAVSTLRLESPLPSDVELQATLSAEDGRVSFFGLVLQDYSSNALLILDYQGLDDFKFVGVDIDQDRWVVGHFDENGWQVDAFLSQPMETETSYDVRVRIQDGTDLTLEVNGSATLSYSYVQPIVDGEIGVGMRNSISDFDNIVLRPYAIPTPTTLPIHEDFETTGESFFQQNVGAANAANGRFVLTPFTNQDALATIQISEALPSSFEMLATINADGGSPDRFSNALMIFDYVAPTDFKFAGAFVGADQWVIGHRDAADWIVDAEFTSPIDPLTDYRLGLRIEEDHSVTLLVDGAARLGHTFVDSVTNGDLGLGTKNAISRYDDLVVQATMPSFATLPLQEDFQDGSADDVQARVGSWSQEAGQLLMTPALFQDSIATLRIADPLPANLSVGATVRTGEQAVDRYSNALLVFDYRGPADFKFAGAFAGADQWVIGHRDASGWIVDADLPATIETLTDYDLQLWIENESKVSLLMGGVTQVSHTYAESLIDGGLGLGTQNAISRFDNLIVESIAPRSPAELPFQEDFQDGTADHFMVEGGSWNVADGRFAVTPPQFSDGISTLPLEESLPSSFEMLATINADGGSPDRFSNALMIFDYVAPTDFKFAGAFVGADQWVIGHRDAADWIVDAEFTSPIDPLTDYRLGLRIEEDHSVTLLVDGAARLGHTFVDSLTNGDLGLGTKNAISRYDDLVVQATMPSFATLPLQEDFQDGSADDVQARVGSWSQEAGQLLMTPALFQDSIATLRIADPLPANLSVGATVRTGEQAVDRYSNALLVFDYRGPADFKFAGAFVGADQWVIGHRDASGWIVDADLPATIETLTDYDLQLWIENESKVSLLMGGVTQVSHTYAESLIDGGLGLGTQNAISRFDNLIVESIAPRSPAELPFQEDFQDGTADHFMVEGGSWNVADGRFAVTPPQFSDGISTLPLEESLPSSFEMLATINADGGSPDRFSNALMIFDYVAPTNFKFAGAFVGADQWVIGHRDAVDWIVDAELTSPIDPLTDYRLGLRIEEDHSVTLLVDGAARLGHTFVDSVTNGDLGLGTKNAISRYDDVTVEDLTIGAITLPAFSAAVSPISEDALPGSLVSSTPTNVDVVTNGTAGDRARVKQPALPRLQHRLFPSDDGYVSSRGNGWPAKTADLTDRIFAEWN